MTRTIDRVMTRDPVTMDHQATIREAAQRMARYDIGDVIVTHDGRVHGIVTDRDIVVRCLARGGDPNEMRLEDICSTNLVTVRPSDTLDDAETLMRNRALKRLIVERDGNALGIVTMGDVERMQHPETVAAAISLAPPSR